MKTLPETAFAADKEIVEPMMQWRYNGQPGGNGWTSESNNAAWYEVTFPKGQLPPRRRASGLTVYNPEHLFYPNTLNRFALGTKNMTLKATTAAA